MVSPISQASQPPAAPQAATAARQSPPQAKPQPAPADTVQLSQAALAARAITQEVSETQAQTAKEAAAGDNQAKRLLARELATEKR
jgi:hypothetical protein